MAGCRQCSAHLSEEATSCGSCGASVTSSTRADPMVGRTLLNQYIVRRKLGQGGFGSVYEAEQPSMERKVAIKTLHPHLTSQPDIVARFRREGLAASRLAHPSAVKMHNFGETEDGVLWMAMEFLLGETLDERVRRKGTLSPREIVEILEPVCEVLAEAHEKGVVHRDLKPDNIMLTPLPGKDMLPKVLDFGIAGILGSNDGATKTGMVSGTPQYMSPEQWKGLKFVDHRTDIYALGIIAYQALSGRLPFEADTAPGWMTKHCLEEPLDLTRATQENPVPLALTRAIMKALAKNPAERYPSALALKDALKDALAAKDDAQPAAPPAELPSAPTLPLYTNTAPTPSYAAPEARVSTPPAPEKKERGFSFSLSLGKFRIAFGIALSLLLLLATRSFLLSTAPEGARSASRDVTAQPLAADKPRQDEAARTFALDGPERPKTSSSQPIKISPAKPILLASTDPERLTGKKHNPSKADLKKPSDHPSLSDPAPPGSGKAKVSPTSTKPGLATKATDADALGLGELSDTKSGETLRDAEDKNDLPPAITAALKTCLGPKAAKNPALFGDYTLSLSFSPEGTLTDAQVAGPKTSSALDTCLLTRLGKLSELFPKRKPKESVVFHFSLPL